MGEMDDNAPTPAQAIADDVAAGSQEPGDERRKEPRRRQYRGGKMVFNDLFSAVDCLVRDISDSGARLECENPQFIPRHLLLQLGDHESFECEVVWKSRTGLGVRFTENAQLNDFLHQVDQVHHQVRTPVAELVTQAEGFRSGAFGRVNRPGFADHLTRLITTSQAFLKAIEALDREYNEEKYRRIKTPPANSG